ncbi:hypothetical protein Goshw_026409 [Gossypium schwendimanii]|uniref:Uncharacterized protein n=1 Tax=Gossypium schwendimanii TaxID=34291 RepID=A0A7J9M854_GOSSC|nr:hypothetical protein [Gossypium schwendimanii]
MPNLEAHIAKYHKAYHPNTEEVVHHYNDHFSRTMLEFYITKKEKNRKKLADRAPGFARGTTGGKGGEFYVVTELIDKAVDPKLGTLHHTTIDARGANVEICNGASITVQFVKNVVIHDLQICNIIPAKGGMIKDGENHHGLWGASDGDGVSLFGATIFPFTIAPMALLMSFKDPQPLPFLTATSLTTMM